MNEPLPDALVAASRLRAAVEDTAAALAGADLERLLACDARLQNVLTGMPGAATLDGEARRQLRREVEEAQAALRRCRRLGATLNEFIRFSFHAQGHAAGYEPGRAQAPHLSGRAFNERV